MVDIYLKLPFLFVILEKPGFLSKQPRGWLGSDNKFVGVNLCVLAGPYAQPSRPLINKNHSRTFH